ncbi:MAG: DUF2147 domain-containing protein [Gammaproteobacteria bacterium]
MRKNLLLVAAVFALFPLAAVAAPSTASPAASAAAANAVTGYWVTDGDKSHVQIYRNADGKYNGRIVWLSEPDFPQNFENKALAGKPQVDYKNPDKSQRDRPLMGLTVLSGFSYQPQHNNWKGNYCYNPEVGKSSNKCLLWMTDGGSKLQVRGYLGIFSETHTWDRYVAPAGAGAPSAATH